MDNLGFKNLMNEMRKAEDNFKEEIKESDALGKGPDKAPKMTGKDPDLSNVNEADEDMTDEDIPSDLGDIEADTVEDEVLSTDAMKKAVIDFVLEAEDSAIEEIYNKYIEKVETSEDEMPEEELETPEEEVEI